MPRDSDAVAAHIREYAAALPDRVPEPAVMGSGMFFSTAGEGKISHLLLLGTKLVECIIDGAHVELILEIGREKIGRLSKLNQLPCFGNRTSQRFFTDNSL